MRVSDRRVPGEWTPGRTVVLTGASVITMDPAGGDFVGDVVVTGSTIAAAGPEAGATAPDDALRGVSPDSDMMAYLHLTHTVLAPLMTPEDMSIGESVTAVRALEEGVTTIVDNSHNVRSLEHGQAVAGALREHYGWAGEVLGVDREALAERAEESRDRLLKQAGVDVGRLRFAGELVLPGSGSGSDSGSGS